MHQEVKRNADRVKILCLSATEPFWPSLEYWKLLFNNSYFWDFTSRHLWLNLIFGINVNFFSKLCFLIAISDFWNWEAEMHLLYFCRSLFYVWIMKSYYLQQGNVFSNLNFVKMVCCLPDFWFPTVRFSDITDIAFNLFCTYFADFGESKIKTFTLCKIEGLVVILLVPYKSTMLINIFLIILMRKV